MGNNKSTTVSTELTPKQIAVLKANTKYTDAEIKQWHQSFIRDCPTGRLDKKQFATVYTQFYPQGNSANFSQYAFKAFDEDNNGSVNFDEFLLAVAANSQGDLDDRLSLAFDIYDISNDQQIDQKEMTKVITSIYDLKGITDRSGERDPKKRATDIISKLDVSGDRKLSKQEFITGCKTDPVLRQVLAPNA